MSKEEILNGNKGLFFNHEDGSKTELISKKDALASMDEYAEQECIGFAEWKLKNGYKWDWDDKVWKTSRLYHVATNDFTEYTTKELYQLFLKSKQP